MTPGALGQLRGRARHRGLELLRAHAQVTDQLVVEHAHPALGDGPEAELAVPGRTDLAHQQHVERHPERARDLVPDGHPAAREREDERLLGAERAEQRRQRRSGVATVAKGVEFRAFAHLRRLRAPTLPQRRS